MTLRDALRADHVGNCDSNACDITAAYRAGCYLWAAHLLMSATDACNTPNVTEAFEPPTDEVLDAERVILLEQPHADCPSCGAIVWTDVDTTCDNCSASVTVDVPEEE